MINAYEIVYDVLHKYRGLAERLAGITDKTATWWRSHGYEPRTVNPEANGNHSDVEDYLRYVRRYEAAMPGAGQMLNNRVHAALQAEFAEHDLTRKTQSDLHVSILQETCDVKKWLAAKDLEQATLPDLAAFEQECDEAIDALMASKARARAISRRIRAQRSAIKAVR